MMHGLVGSALQTPTTTTHALKVAPNMVDSISPGTPTHSNIHSPGEPGPKSTAATLEHSD